MRTRLYLLRHGATDANLARPPRLLGGKLNPPLAPLGIRQAECTRDLLAVRPIDVCYCSPLKRAVQTARIISEAHDLEPIVHDSFIECDLGAWEGLDWEHIRRTDSERYQQFVKDPARHGHPEGETYAAVLERTNKVIDRLMERHAGGAILVVAHHVVNRVYLAELLGLGPERARQVSLDPCAISVLEHDGDRTAVATLNAAFHLQGLAA